MRNLLRFVRALATILLGALSGVLIAECGVRIVTRADPVAENTWLRREMTLRHAGLLHVHDAALGWRNRPGADTDFESPEFRVHVRINERGLRGPSVAATPEARKRRVLFVGDSFVFGWGVEENETFAAELARRIPDLEPVLMGVAGYGTDQELV